MKTKDEIINNYADEFVWHLIPFGGLDVMHLVRKAYEFNITPRELAAILYEQADNFCLNMFNNECTTDLNALFNMYIIDRADENISEKLEMSIRDYDVCFFANYLDDPLQYSNEVIEDISKAIKEHEVTREDFDVYAQYVLDEMGIELEN